MSVIYCGGVWGWPGVEALHLGPYSCLNCRRVVYEGHIDCSCRLNHPSRCEAVSHVR